FKVGSIGAIAVAQSDPNIIYVGTGSACIRSNVSTGRGVYKSTDAAKTWQCVGLPQAGQIGAMLVHPKNADLVYVAALGQAFGPNPERGVYRSQDGGESWQLVLFVSDSTGAVDLSMNPENPDEIYASMWRAERKPWTIISGGLEGGIYKTEDGGDHWKKIERGLPQGLIGKTAVSVSPANPRRVYALVEAPNDQGGLYRSDDGGESFQFINSQKSLMYRPFYYTHVTAAPNDENVVYVNNEGFFKSVDAGSTFTRIRTPHGDNHDLWIHPQDPDFLFQANDGGVNVSLDGGKTWSEQHNQATAELYHVVVDNQYPYWLYGEQQDNSTIMVPSLPPVAGGYISPKQFWRAVAGCETGPIAVHPLKPHIVYGGCKGRFSRFNHLTGQEMQYWVYPHFNYGHAASEMPYRFQRTSPIEISPHNPDVIYHTSQYVHKTTDEGRTWEIISPDLTAKQPGTQGFSGEPITHDITGEEIYSAIYQLRESLHEEGVLWAGSNDGLLHITRDGGQNWQNITPKDLLPGGRVQTIDPSPHDPATAYVAIYRYMLNDWAPYIYKTENYGQSWQRLTDGNNGIPADYPTRVVREDPDRKGLLYAGTEFGMFVSFDDGQHWQSLQLNLPSTPITDIRVHRKDLVLSTMGRSFWILDDITPLHQLSEEVTTAQNHLFKPRNTYRYRWSGSRRGGDGARPEYPPSGVLIYYHLAQKATDKMTLEIMDASGNLVRSYVSDTTRSAASRQTGASSFFRGRETRLPRTAGMHRVAWDLRYAGPSSFESGQSSGPGPLAVPGTYQVRLKIGEWSQTQTFELLMDPRLAADGVTLADIQEQFDLNLRMRDRLSELRATVARIRSIRSQLDSVLSDAEMALDVVDKTKQVRKNLTGIEEALVQTRQGKVGAQLKPKLNRQITYLAGMLMQADQKPGRDAYARFEDIEKILTGHLSNFQKTLHKDLKELNQTLQARGRTAVK
ncbi:MAG: WD40/YVTN/BNR-like repeat-containing protein, partial [bacterium]